MDLRQRRLLGFNRVDKEFQSGMNFSKQTLIRLQCTAN